jgi:SsrA-binding protein
MAERDGEKIIVSNRRAFHDYHVLDRVEAGISLQGTEVKSLRMKGGMQLKDCYVNFEKGEAFLVGAHINPYEMGNMAEKGLTVIPLGVYFKKGRVKVELGLCQGKHTFDKRASIKDRESRREMDRAVKDIRRA